VYVPKPEEGATVEALRRLLRVIIGLGAGGLAALTPGGPAAASSGCAHADVVPSPANLPQVRHATLCLINQQRRAHGLGKLHRRSSLKHAAQAHSDDMVRRGYFSHLTPRGLTVSTRIRHTAYASSHTRLRAGENIAWAQGWLSTPRSIVRTWMASAAHRANILSGVYRHVGVGTALGSPGLGGGGATFTVVFASRF
jgi:uncharacterized protein YkwD